MPMLPMIDKLVNPMKQQLKKTIFFALSLGIGAANFTLLKTEPASAYCVYNGSDEKITAIQSPVKGDSFKAVIEPGKNACCHWSDTSCTTNGDGRYGTTTFLLFKGALDIDKITREKVLEEVLGTVTGGLTDKLFEKLEQEGYASKDQVLGPVDTYNGGIVWYDGTKAPVGCWTGPCLGQYVNNDGTTGYPQE